MKPVANSLVGKKVKEKKNHMSFREVGAELRKNKLVYAMMTPSILWVLIFSYIPMIGIIIAFKNYDMSQGILGSPWSGLENFKFLFHHKDIFQITFNTIYLNVLFILTGTFTSVLLALMFVEIKNNFFKKLSQSIAILPHFVSWAIVSMFLLGFLSTSGIVNKILMSLGMDPIQFYTTPGPWRFILVIVKIWQGAGFGTVIYVATITGMDAGIYEAATIDGASRLQKITKITFPLLRPTIIMLTIMNVGGIFRGDFGMIYALVGDNSTLFPTIDVVDTFTYRALRTLGDMGMSTATSLFQSVIGLLMVLGTNALAKKLEPDSAIF